MTLNTGVNRYQQNTINTASPQELTMMLYNGLVRFIKSSVLSLDNNNLEEANNFNVRAQDIISEFMLTLDMRYEVSSNLMALYDYMKRRLIEANIKKDKEITIEVQGFAEELRDTWFQAMKLAKQQVAQVSQVAQAR